MDTKAKGGYDDTAGVRKRGKSVHISFVWGDPECSVISYSGR